MSQVILVRPGHTDFDEQNRIQGLLDLPLSERGREHVDALIEQLRPERIEVILTDPGEPARTTANVLGDALDVPVKERPELHNLDQGLWQGLELDSIRRKYPKLIKQWHEHPETICPPQGEPVCDAMKRIELALKKPLKKYRKIAIVAADPLAALIAGMLRGGKPDFTGPMCSHTGRCVEVLSNDAPAAATTPAATTAAATTPAATTPAATTPAATTPAPTAVNGNGAALNTVSPERNGHGFGA